MSLRFLAQKILRALLTLLLAVSFVFVVLRSAGDPVRIMLPDDAPEAMIAQYRRDLGMDRSIPEQYVGYLGAVLRGDLGRSFHQGRDAVTVVSERLAPTLLLTGTAFAIMVGVGVPLGMLAALNRGSLVDRFAMLAAVAGYSVPGFFLGVILILVFAVELRWLPTGGYGTWRHLVMPAATLGLAGAGVLARFTRSAVLEVIGRLHIRAAHARGLPGRRVLWREALPNAAIPTVTVIGFMVGGLVAGAIIIETVFAWPGVGRLLQASVALRDLPVVQVVILLVAASMTTANLIVDLLYGWLDPRIADGRARAAGAR
jgi:peptide/nickel transport system permease protein